MVPAKRAETDAGGSARDGKPEAVGDVDGRAAKYRASLAEERERLVVPAAQGPTCAGSIRRDEFQVPPPAHPCFQYFSLLMWVAKHLYRAMNRRNGPERIVFG